MNFLRFQLRPLFALLCLGSTAAWAQETLTLQQAIRQALAHSPEATVATADMADANAAASLARTSLLPRLQFTEDISRGDDPVYAFGSRLRQRAFTQADFALNALNRPQPIGNFSTHFSGTWVAFDSFKTEREIRRADLSKASVAFSAKAIDQQIVLGVVTAYQSVLLAQKQVEVARHEEETSTALLDSVADRVKAGLTVESDRMSALVNVAARREERIAADGALDLARAQLREAMGSPDLTISDLQPIEPHVFPVLPLEHALAVAAKSRPDLIAMAHAQSAQSSAVAAAKSDLGPSVNAYGNWEQDKGSLGSSGGNSWTAGVQISIDILPAGKRAQLARAVAARQRFEGQFSASQRRVRLQVTEAHIHRHTAELSLETSKDAMDQSSESLRILKNRYGAGLATVTDVLRAEDAERQSKSSYWQAVYNSAMAYAEWLFATGTLTPDSAEELQ
jgi:outer membrane protein TolC